MVSIFNWSVKDIPLFLCCFVCLFNICVFEFYFYQPQSNQKQPTLAHNLMISGVEVPFLISNIYCVRELNFYPDVFFLLSFPSAVKTSSYPFCCKTMVDSSLPFSILYIIIQMSFSMIFFCVHCRQFLGVSAPLYQFILHYINWQMLLARLTCISTYP